MKMNRLFRRALALVTALFLLCQQMPVIAAAEDWSSAASDAIGRAEYVSVRFTADGSEVSALMAQVGATLDALPEAPEREGYVFLGWFAGEEQVTGETVVAGEMEISASYYRADYPALEKDYADDQIAVHISAPAGALPEGVVPVVVPVTEAQVRGIVENVMGHEVGKIAAVDISFLDADGIKIQPERPVHVTFTLTGMQVENPTVVHIPDELMNAASGPRRLMSAKGAKAPAAEIVPARVNGQTVSFDAGSFSVYAVVEPSHDEFSRVALEFYNGDTLIETMYVKNTDTRAELDLVIFDPGAGAVGEGEVFAGWIIDNKDFTTEDLGDIKDIDEVRDWAATLDITETDPITTYRLDAAICKLYLIRYYDYDDDDETAPGTVVGMDGVLVKSSEHGTASVDYTVTQAYSPKDDVHNFEGWILQDDSVANVTSTVPADRIYANNTGISIKGDIEFLVNAPKGHWLVFDENGKGGTYNAPHFIKDGEVTVQPRDDEDMIRKGYSFGGWYDTKEHADAHGANPSVTTGKFTFGGEISERTTLYASWIPNTRAPYTVIFWRQKLSADGKGVQDAYDVIGSYVNENGVVGQNIPYTSVDNGDEDYVTGVGNGNGHYTGFCLTPDSIGQQVTITPEGDAVLNLYYNRIKYNFKFYLYRNGTQNNRYDYANNSGTGSSLNDLVTWHSNQTEHPSVNGKTIQSETVGSRTYYYFVMPAYYGADISSEWPKYDEITGANGREAVSFVMMVGTKLKPNPTNQGSGTVKGVITVMNENILGATNNANGNYIVIRFPGSYFNWRYHIWFETVEGEDYSDKTTYYYQGKTYYEDTVLVVRSSNTDEVNQNEPKYQGFDYIMRVGEDRNGVWETLSGNNKVGEHWNTNNNGVWINHTDNGTNNTLYHLNYIYNRINHTISYFDGNYVDGGNNPIQNRSENLLHESEEIPQGASIASYGNYVPDPPEDGYVFDGWYTDAGCTTLFDWNTTMPREEGVMVYAKWIRVQYRVFLHPNAGRDTSLDWGASNVDMSFRVTYGGKVSTPTGTRENSGYSFVGWYTDPSLSSGSLFDAATVLNDTTVTAAYNKTEPTELDKWGDPISQTNGDVGRKWVTKKLDLYAKWRKNIDDSDGIRVEYWPTDDEGHTGTNPPDDDSLYPDQTNVSTQAAATAPAGMTFKCWVIQRWDADENAYVDVEEILPGQRFTVDADLAKKEPDPETEGKFKYTMRLRAEYQQPESGVSTHIWWFRNYSTSGASTHEGFHRDENIKINEAVSIQAAPTRDGYLFLGWAREPVGTTHSHDDTPETITDNPIGDVLSLTENDVYLAWDGSKYTLNDSTRGQYNGATVTQVAADEKTPYHDMYAVWLRMEVTKTVNGILADEYADKITDHEFQFAVKKTSNGKYMGPDGKFDKNTIDEARVFTLGAGASNGVAGTPVSVPGLGGGEYTYEEITASTVIDGYTLDTAHSTTTVTKRSNQAVNGLLSIAFNNTYTRDEGSLTITKSVVGHDTGAYPYTFKIKSGDRWITGAGTQASPYVLTDDEEDAATWSVTSASASSVTINGLPAGNTYTVEELYTDEPFDEDDTANIENYDLAVTYNPASVALAKDGSGTVAVTNTYTRQQADVTVTKTYSGYTLPSSFEIDYTGSEDTEGTLTLTGSPTPSTATEGGVTTLTWVLEDMNVGETLTFTETGYTVANYDVTTSANGTADATSAALTVAKIAEGAEDTNTVDFVNVYERQKADVTVTKSYSGYDLPDSFEITFTGSEDASGTLTATGTNPAPTTETEGGVTTLTWVLEDMNVGETLTFTETGYTVANYDVTTSANGTANATSAALTVAKIAAGAEDTNTVDFVNVYERQKADVTVTKTYSGVELPTSFAISYDGDEDAEGTLTLTGSPTPSTATEGDATVVTWVLEDMNVGETLTFTETGYTVPNYVVVTTAGGEEGETSTDLTVAKIAAGAEDTNQVEFVNTYELDVAPVTLAKDVEGNLLSTTDEFDFTIKVYTAEGDEITEDITWSTYVNDLTEDDGAVDLGEFPIGATVKITETGLPEADDYETTATLNSSGSGVNVTTPADKTTREITFVVPEPEMDDNGDPVPAAVVVKNEWNLVIPTGIASDSMPYVVICGGGLMSVALWLMLRRREEH